MNKSAEISKDGKTLTVNTFKDLKHFLDRVRYKHFQITVDKPIKELIVKDSKTDWTVNYVKELLRNAALQTVENFEIISPDSRFCTIDGLLYSGSGENLYLCPIGREGTLIIPDGTKMIFVEACRNCKFDKVVLPDSVEIIDTYAFSRSWNLKEVEGGKNVERIRDYAFSGCMNLKHFTFHAKLRGIGGAAFSNTSLSEINLPRGLRTIGPRAFNTVGTSKGFASCAGQSDMYEIRIPSTVQNIGAAAFPNASYIYIPKKVMESMSWSGIAKIGLRSCNLCICHSCNTWKLEVEGLPVIIMPKILTEIPSAARTICRLIESEGKRTPPAMYSYSKDAFARSAAIEQHKIYPDTKTKAYITRNATLFLSDALSNESDWNQVIIDFIKDGVFTDTALRKILKKLDDEKYENVTVLKSYILDKINKKSSTFKL